VLLILAGLLAFWLLDQASTNGRYQAIPLGKGMLVILNTRTGAWHPDILNKTQVQDLMRRRQEGTR
jgi:hypothetical protein